MLNQEQIIALNTNRPGTAWPIKLNH